MAPSILFPPLGSRVTGRWKGRDNTQTDLIQSKMGINQNMVW